MAERSEAMSGDAATEASPHGLRQRYRAQYAKLPPGAQMIGLQLWLPFVFVLAFCLCYVAAFHAPAPQHVPVAIVGSGPQTDAFAAQLQKTSDGALDVRVEPDLASARQNVQTGELAAAYAPRGKTAELILASGAQFQLATTAKSTFATVAATSGAKLTVHDLAPLPAHDAYGTTLFYVTLVWTISGYMVGMFLGMMGAALRHRVRIGILAGAAVLLTLISTLLIRFALGAVAGNFFELWGIGVLTAFAVGLVVNGLGYFMGRFVTAAALIVFVFFNVPSSGGAYPPEYIPEPFKALHPVVSATGTLDMARSVVYDVGPGVGSGALILVCYLALGAAITAVGKPFFEWRAAWRERRGVQPSMMMAAQRAAMAAAAASTPDAAETEGEGQPAAPRGDAKPADTPAQPRIATYSVGEVDGDAAAAVTGTGTGP